MESFNERLAKKIRKILLINVDNEIKKKKKEQKFHFNKFNVSNSTRN